MGSWREGVDQMISAFKDSAKKFDLQLVANDRLVKVFKNERHAQMCLEDQHSAWCGTDWCQDASHKPVVMSQGGGGGASVVTGAVGLEKWGQKQETFRRQNLQGLLATDWRKWT